MVRGKIPYSCQEILTRLGAAETLLDASSVALPVVVEGQLFTCLDVHHGEQAYAPNVVHVPLRRLAVGLATVVYEPTQMPSC
jgi:hypothetical protein